MIVIPREICRVTNNAFSFEWIVRNGRGGYAAASIGGALTRRQHGLLVASPTLAAKPHVMLAKLDEEIQVQEQVFKLGTNEYQTNVTSPDGFLYLQQTTLEGELARFTYETGRFQLTKSIWMEPKRATTCVHYQLSEQSEPAQLTLVPMCDYRPFDTVTNGNDQPRLTAQAFENGFTILTRDGVPAYRCVTTAPATFTPLDLWYWRFQLRADDSISTDLFVPGLVRLVLEPGAAFTVIITAEPEMALTLDADARMAQARTWHNAPAASETFSPALYSA